MFIKLLCWSTSKRKSHWMSTTNEASNARGQEPLSKNQSCSQSLWLSF